jgi:hypothetical protein|nr:MAG TPA: hypothetical protein [Caudoviricetes sp.]
MGHAEFLRELNARPVAVYPIYIEFTGTVTAGMLLSQLMFYFQSLKKDKIFKTNEEICAETMLTINELRAAKKIIKECGFIETSKEGLPARTFYKIDWGKYYKIMSAFAAEKQRNNNGEINPASSIKSTRPVELNSRDQLSEIHATNKNNNFNTQTTSETTSENSFSAREKNQTSLNAPTLKENPNENFKNRPLNENQAGYGVEKPNLASKPTLEAKPSLVTTKLNTTSDYVSYTSPKNYATEKEWYAALKMTDLMGWNIEGILYTHLIPYLEDKRGRPLQDFEIRRISVELAKYVGISQLEIVRRCIKGGFREIKPFGTDKLRKDYPDMCWELGDNYEI